MILFTPKSNLIISQNKSSKPDVTINTKSEAQVNKQTGTLATSVTLNRNNHTISQHIVVLGRGVALHVTSPSHLANSELSTLNPLISHNILTSFVSLPHAFA